MLQLAFGKWQKVWQVGTVLCVHHAAYTFSTFGDVPTFYAKFLDSAAPVEFPIVQVTPRFLTNSGRHLRVILSGWSVRILVQVPKCQ